MPLVLLFAVFSHFSDPPQNCVTNNRESPTIASTEIFSMTYLLFRLGCWSIIITSITPLFVILFLRCLTPTCGWEDFILFIRRLWTFKTKKLVLLLLLFGFLRCIFLRPSSSEVVSRHVVSIANFVNLSKKLRFSDKFETESIKRFMLKNHEYGLIRRSLLITSGSVEK